MVLSILIILSFQDGETQDPREAADERLHGLGSGGQEATGGSVSVAAQCRAEQDVGETVEVKI